MSIVREAKEKKKEEKRRRCKVVDVESIRSFEEEEEGELQIRGGRWICVLVVLRAEGWV